MWTARKTMTTEAGVREPGDPCPECEGWPNLRAYVSGGFVAWVEPAPEQAPPLAAGNAPPAHAASEPPPAPVEPLASQPAPVSGDGAGTPDWLPPPPPEPPAPAPVPWTAPRRRRAAH